MLYFNKYSINEILSKYNIHILKYIKKNNIFLITSSIFIYNNQNYY